MKVTNANQFQKLIEELDKNPSLAIGFRRGTVPSNYKEQWEEISNSLNALGPPRRMGDGWQKVWRDLKFKVKKKMVANKTERNATGGGRFNQFILSPLEEAVANLLQFQKQFNPEGTVQGVQCENQGNECDVPEEEHALNIKEEMPEDTEFFIINSPCDQELHESPPESTEQSISSKNCRTPKKRLRSELQEELLQNQSDSQTKLLTELSNSLSSIKRSIGDLEKRQKQLLVVEEKKLKLLEERNQMDKERSKREEEVHESDLQIKRIELFIKEKELQLLNKKLTE